MMLGSSVAEQVTVNQEQRPLNFTVASIGAKSCGQWVSTVIKSCKFFYNRTG